LFYIDDFWVDIDCGDLSEDAVELLSKEHGKETGSGT